MQLLVLALLAVGALALPAPQANEKKETFTGHRLLAVVPETDEQVKALHQLEAGDMYVDFWLDAVKGRNSTFRVPPESYKDVSKFLKKNKLQARLLHHDIEAMFEEEDRKEAERIARMGEVPQALNTVDRHDFYRTLTEVNNYLDTIAARYPSWVSVGNLGLTSIEGRAIRYIELNVGSSKPRVFVECGIHAREWVSPAVCLYFIDRVLNNYNSDSQAKAMLDKYYWTVVPVANPDGYTYTHTTNRLWRKNRAPCSGSSSVGVDLNRNWDAFWNTEGVGASCSSDTWPGTSVFSEPETRAIRDYVRSKPARLYISFHSYSQMLFVPYGYTANREPSNGPQHRTIANNARTAIANTHGRSYIVGTPPQILYAASGGSYDWARLNGGAEFAWTYELRPDQNDFATGFRLPASQIVPCSEEVWASLVVISSQT